MRSTHLSRRSHARESRGSGRIARSSAMFNRIVLPLDGSEIAQCAMPYALALADVARVPLTLLQVVPRGRAALEVTLRYDAAEEAAALDRCGEALDAVAESLRTASRIVDVYVT